MIIPISDFIDLLRNGKSVRQSADAGGVPITRIETIADWRVNSKMFCLHLWASGAITHPWFFPRFLEASLGLICQVRYEVFHQLQ